MLTDLLWSVRVVYLRPLVWSILQNIYVQTSKFQLKSDFVPLATLWQSPHDNTICATVHTFQIGGLHGFSTDCETVYQNSLPLDPRWEGKHDSTDIHTCKTMPFAAMIWQKINMIYHFYARANWSTVRSTKWPSTIGIHFITALHSLPVRWLQGQGAHITTVSWLHVIKMRFCHEVTIMTTLCYLTTILP